MKTYIADLIPQIKKASKLLDDKTLLANKNWISIGDSIEIKRVYIFESNGELDIFENGQGVDCGTWKFIGENSLKLKLKDGSTFLLKHGFIDKDVMALKLDGINTYAFFVAESKFDNGLKVIDQVLKYLEKNYSVGFGPKFPKAEFGYTVLHEIDRFDLSWFDYTEYHVKFKNGYESKVFSGSNS
ncbi:MAG: hypothetical protein ACK5CY_02760, partial [Bacteroidia bacterium]